MKKAFDQTVRDLKREVNKKVLKIPGIEQKVLDATSNEPWGPHGMLLADIAQASRNYHEYQMIMSIIWKRVNDTGKNWRHVYKALIVLEYMVANGSERVIDEIREHAYQIQTLNSFQYIDSSGKDQGNNVRRKSQSLVVLVNDKERIEEVRQKAAANRDKFRSMSSSGGMYRPGSYPDFGGYGGSKNDDYRFEEYRGRDDRNYDYGRDRDGSYYKDGDSSNRDGRDNYRDGDYRGRSYSTDDHHYGSRSRSSDQYRNQDRNFDDDGQYSSRGGRADSEYDNFHGERKLDRKFSEQNLSAPPNYEEAVNESQSPNLKEREGGNSAAAAPNLPLSPPVINNKATAQEPTASSPPPPAQDFETFDEFDPRVPVSVVPSTSKNAEGDLFGSLSDSFSSNPLAIMPLTPLITSSEVDRPHTAGGPTFISQQGFEDPFGDSPFKVVSSTENIPIPQPAPSASIGSNFNPVTEQPQMGVSAEEKVPNFGLQNSVSGMTYSLAETPSSVPSDLTPGFPPLPSGVPPLNPNMYGGVLPQTALTIPQASAPVIPQVPIQVPNYDVYSNSQFPQTGRTISMVSQANVSSSPGSLALVPQQPSKDKFETKSTVWADTLSRGLVNLNISGSRTNPLVDIGVDFDALNRKEKRMEKAPANPPISTVTMGKAMGSGSGIGRSGTSTLRPPMNPMIGSGMGMGMNMGVGSGSGMGMGMGMGMGTGTGTGTGTGMGMGGYRGMGQPMGQSIGMGMNANISMGMNPGMMQQPGIPRGAAMPRAYNPVMGSDGYTQPPYGGGYH